MFKELRNTIFDNEFKLTLYNNKIYINNYEEIIMFDDNQLLIKLKNKFLKIKGQALIITRFENNEMCIKGIIKTIELE